MIKKVTFEILRYILNLPELLAINKDRYYDMYSFHLSQDVNLEERWNQKTETIDIRRVENQDPHERDKFIVLKYISQTLGPFNRQTYALRFDGKWIEIKEGEEYPNECILYLEKAPKNDC